MNPASRSVSVLEHHACEAAPVYTRHVKSGAAPPGSSCAMKAGPLFAVQHKHAPSAKGTTRNARVRSQPATVWRGVHVPHHQGQHRHPLTALVRCLLPCCPLGARLPLPETDIFSPQETAMLASMLATPGPRLERSDGSMPLKRPLRASTRVLAPRVRFRRLDATGSIDSLVALRRILRHPPVYQYGTG